MKGVLVMRAVLWGLVAVVVGCGGGNAEKRGAAKGNVIARVARVDMKEPRFTQATVEVVLAVENESTKAIKIGGAEIEVTFAGAGADGDAAGSGGDAPDGEGTVFKGAMQTRGNSSVEPGGSATIPVEVQLIYPTEPAAFITFAQASIQKLKVVGHVKTAAGNLEVNDMTDFPTPKLLIGQVKDAQVASIDDGAAGEVVLDLVLFNPNPFAVKADVWSLKITVAGKDLKEFEVAQGENIQANAGVAYSESFKIDKEHWGPDFKAVLKKPVMPWSVAGNIKVGEVSYPTNVKGEMKFHR